MGEWLGVGNIIIIADSLFKYTPIPNIIQLNPVFDIVLIDFVWHGCVFVFANDKYSFLSGYINN